uniref:Peptidase S9 prolyl oligopeptidase catalytic domain-containing protein n=1 Tax=Oryza nivara TaxID=4536 RepID=A0A0E0HMP0_ORYNI
MHSQASAAAEKAVVAPYGSWESPISAAAVSAAGRTVEGLAVAGDGRLLWVETRPEEGGRAVLVKEAAEPGGDAVDVTPEGFAVRSLAQEYGGGAFAVQGDVVVFSNYSDQRLYKQTIGDNSAQPLTPDYTGSVLRYADGVFDPHFCRYVTIMEDHRKDSSNPVTTIAAVTISERDANEPTVLVSGNDFYAFPRIDPIKRRMAWIEWSNPNMSWDKAQLWVGYFSEKGEVHNKICIAGGDPTLVESPTEPKWTSKGELFFITDRESGFWNIYKWDEESNLTVQLYSLDAEFSKPMWIFGVSSYGFLGKDDTSNKIVCCYRQNGRSCAGVLDHDSGSFSELDIPFSSVTNIVSGDGFFYVEGASATLPVSIAKSPARRLMLISMPRTIIFSKGRQMRNLRYWSEPMVDLQMKHVEFWILVFSTGQAEDGHLLMLTMGEAQVETGRVDAQRLCVTGESAGGFTTLACLAFRQIFKAGNRKAYFERSPINFVDRFSCPIILFQGLEDTVVSPVQATTIYKAIKDKGLPVALVEYEGEQHGFRKAENIKFTLEQQMVFFARLVGHFKVADGITPIKIDNFDEPSL